MFTQPSVNQIKSAYQGNPAPLARKVDQDKKQNGGIPSDLRQLLALSDIAKGRNAAGIQQGLNIPTNMPTVAQNMQQLAQQAMQSRLMEQAREQQRLQQKPPTVPFGTPQPEEQPQGIDALRANVGEAYAEGGIIGFDGKTGSDVKDPTEKNKSFIERFLYSNISPVERARKDALEAQAESKRTVPTRINEERDRNMAIVNKPDPNKTQETLERLGIVTRQEQPMQQVIGQAPPKADVPPPSPPPLRKNPVAQTQTSVNTDSAPMPGGLKDLVSSLATPGGDYTRKMLNQDENALAATKRALYDKEVGARDLSIYDRTAAELEARKQKLNAPKAGYDAMMEYLEQIAIGGGRTSAESGALGASRQRALQKDRLSQQDVLMDKILELGAKKSDAIFAEKKGMFDLTQAERDRIIKEKTDAAKQLNLSEDETRKLIEQGIQKELDRKQQAAENEKNRLSNIRTAQIGAQDRDQLMNRARALMAVDKTLTLEEAMRRAALAAGATQLEATGSRETKAYSDAKEKLDARFQYLISDTPFGKKQKQLYDAALADLKATYGTSDGINTLPRTQAAPLPSKDKLVVGQIYQTARGPAKWNGTAFEQ